jgi:hypothetical protein
MRVFLLAALGCLLTALVVVGQGFVSEELSPRALSLGGAFVGLADDASAALWNPAGLFTLKGIHIIARLSMPSPKTPFDISGGAIGGGFFSIGGALWYGSRTIKAPVPGEQSLAVVAAGAGVRETMAAGVTLKLYEELQSGKRWRGTGMDLGLLVRFGQVLQGGLVITDLLSTRLVSTESFEFEKEIPLIVRMGAVLKLWEDRLRLLGALDLARHEELRAIRFGAEVRLFEGIALRVGWNGHEITWGAGFGIFEILQSDFAWHADGWAISTEIVFGK